jgi:6-methylsalicylate decarboxylase
MAEPIVRADGCVDVHHHFYPPEYLASLDEAARLPMLTQWSVARTLEDMDSHGVATAILSLSPPGARDRTLARICNEYGARMAHDNPGRFGLFAAMPMPDVEATLAEIAYALEVLKVDGIGLMTSYGDRWPGDPAFDPVFAELNRRRALVYIHPLAPACCRALMDWVPAPVIEYPFDTTRAIVSLLFSGTLSRFPDIRFAFSHGGGTLPMLAGRIRTSVVSPRARERVPNGVDHELKKLYYDLAIAAFEPSLAALLAYVPATQVLMGSDFPYHSIGRTIEGIAAAGLDSGTLAAIYRGNAERLIPRLRGA